MNKEGMKSGIYILKNHENDKIFIGASLDVERAFKTLRLAAETHSTGELPRVNNQHTRVCDKLLEDVRDKPTFFSFKVLGKFEPKYLNKGVEFYQALYKDNKFYCDGKVVEARDHELSKYVTQEDNYYYYNYEDDNYSASIKTNKLKILKQKVKELDLPW